MYCVSCGKKLEDGDSFCPGCGAPAVAVKEGGAPVSPDSGIKPGCSDKINDPAIRAAMKKNNKVAGVFAVLLVLAPPVVTLIISLFFGAMAAFAIARMRWKLSEFMHTFFLIGMMVPVHCVLIPLFVRFAKLGLTNSQGGLMIPYITFSLPMTIFLLTGFFRSMPGEMFEAAAIDGCGIYGCFFRIALPLCRTGFFVSGLMTFINNWNELLLAMVFISDPMKKTLPVTLTYFVGPYATNYVQMFAAIIIAIAPTVVVYSLFSNQIVEGLTTGAVKG